LKDPEKYRVEAEYQDTKKGGNYESKADEPKSLIAARGRINIQDGEQTVEENGEQYAEPGDDKGISGMIPPKGRFHIAREAKPCCAAKQTVRIARDTL